MLRIFHEIYFVKEYEKEIDHTYKLSEKQF